MPTLYTNVIHSFYRPVLLSDLVKANLMSDEVKECRYSYCLNFNKYRILYKVFSLIWNCQHMSPIFSTDIELSNILRVSSRGAVYDYVIVSKDGWLEIELLYV